MNNPGFKPTVWSNDPESPTSKMETTLTKGRFIFPQKKDVDGKSVLGSEIDDVPMKLHKFQDGKNLFWFGVATFRSVSDDFPSGINGGSVRFDDGLGGLVSFLTDGTPEIAFVGVSGLVPSN